MCNLFNWLLHKKYTGWYTIALSISCNIGKMKEEAHKRSEENVVPSRS